MKNQMLFVDNKHTFFNQEKQKYIINFKKNKTVSAY